MISDGTSKDYWFFLVYIGFCFRLFRERHACRIPSNPQMVCYESCINIWCFDIHGLYNCF